MELKAVMVSLLCLLACSAGCANQPATVHNVSEQAYVVDYTATRRGAYIRMLPEGAERPRTIICAEPAPDVAATLTTDLQAITDLARRSQTLQMMREALYRLSELQANTGMDPERAAQVYLEVIKAMQAMAYAELGNSALDADGTFGARVQLLAPGVWTVNSNL